MTEFVRRNSTLCHGGLLIALGLIAFWPSVNFGFVNWDDPAYIQHNPLITSWSLSNLKGIATEVVTRNYAPVTIFSLLVDHTIWGMDPFGYHAANVLLHLVNGILVFLLLRRLTGSTFIGWFTAALFLVHPVQIESVAWISSRKGLLCSLLMLSAMLVRMKAEPRPRDDAWYFSLLALALLSKAHAVVLPPMILLYDMLISRQRFATVMPRHFIPAFMSLILLLLTMGAQNTVLGGVRQHMSLGLLQIIAVDITILWQYLGMLFCPINLCVMYDPPTTGIGMPVFLGSLAWAIVALGLWRIRHSQPLWNLGALSFLLLLFPMLNFFRITTLMNDRYLYLPCVIVFAMIAGVLREIPELISRRRTPILRYVGSASTVVLSIVAVAGSLFLTSQHLPVWQNSESLWTHALSRYPRMPILRIQMAFTLHDSGRVAEALREMTVAQKDCNPDDLDRERIEHYLQQWKTELTERTRPASVADVSAQGMPDELYGHSRQIQSAR